MASKSEQKTKNTTKIKERTAFIKDVKNGKYGTVEKTTIVYARMSEQAQPYENTKNNLYYGIR